MCQSTELGSARSGLLEQVINSNECSVSYDQPEHTLISKHPLTLNCRQGDVSTFQTLGFVLKWLWHWFSNVFSLKFNGKMIGKFVFDSWLSSVSYTREIRFPVGPTSKTPHPSCRYLQTWLNLIHLSVEDASTPVFVSSICSNTLNGTMREQEKRHMYIVCMSCYNLIRTKGYCLAVGYLTPQPVLGYAYSDPERHAVDIEVHNLCKICT